MCRDGRVFELGWAAASFEGAAPTRVYIRPAHVAANPSARHCPGGKRVHRMQRTDAPVDYLSTSRSLVGGGCTLPARALGTGKNQDQPDRYDSRRWEGGEAGAVRPEARAVRLGRFPALELGLKGVGATRSANVPRPVMVGFGKCVVQWVWSSSGGRGFVRGNTVQAGSSSGWVRGQRRELEAWGGETRFWVGAGG